MSDRFAHQLRLDQIRDGERLDLVADEAERDGDRERLGLPSLDRLDAHVDLERDRRGGSARGAAASPRSSRAASSPASPSPAHVDEPFAICFMPEPAGERPDEEIELGEADCDTVFYEGGTIDLGGAMADTLALSLDPYPRSAGAEAALKEAGVLTEEQAGPFAVLAELKRSERREPRTERRRPGRCRTPRAADAIACAAARRRRIAAEVVAERAAPPPPPPPSRLSSSTSSPRNFCSTISVV